MYIQLETIDDTNTFCVSLDNLGLKCVQIQQAGIETYIEQGKGKYLLISINLLIPEEKGRNEAK